MKYKLLIFRDWESIGEYEFSISGNSDNAISLQRTLSNLKSDLSGVILGDNGIICHSANLPKTNISWRENVPHY